MLATGVNMKNNIKNLRKNNGWTQMELSLQTKLIDLDKKGITRSTISDIEKYHVAIKGRNLKLLMRVFNVDESEIFN
jgi:transcriptional regulator with XRE-family HTH domain